MFSLASLCWIQSGLFTQEMFYKKSLLSFENSIFFNLHSQSIRDSKKKEKLLKTFHGGSYFLAEMGNCVTSCFQITWSHGTLLFIVPWLSLVPLPSSPRHHYTELCTFLCDSSWQHLLKPVRIGCQGQLAVPLWACQSAQWCHGSEFVNHCCKQYHGHYLVYAPVYRVQDFVLLAYHYFINKSALSKNCSFGELTLNHQPRKLFWNWKNKN